MIRSFGNRIFQPRSDAIADCRSAGVRVIMITGDQPATAFAVANQIGLLKPTDPVDICVKQCTALRDKNDDLIPDDEVDKLCNAVTVFSRAQPEDKIAIVKYYVFYKPKLERNFSNFLVLTFF